MERLFNNKTSKLKKTKTARNNNRIQIGMSPRLAPASHFCNIKPQIMNVLGFIVVLSWCFQASEWRVMKWVMHTKCSWKPSQLAATNAAADFTVGGGVARLAAAWRTGAWWALWQSCVKRANGWTSAAGLTAWNGQGLEASAYYNEELCPHPFLQCCQPVSELQQHCSDSVFAPTWRCQFCSRQQHKKRTLAAAVW